MADLPVNTTPFEQAPLNKQRADKFLLVLTPPKIFRDYDVNKVYPETMQYSVYGTVIPEINIPSVTVGFGNQSLKLSSYARSPYSDITVNFTVDNRFKNYYFIYKWLDLLNDDKYAIFAKDDTGGIDHVVKSIRRTSFKDSGESDLYYTDFTLFSLDEYNNKIAEFTYTKAFPVSLGSLNANYRDSSQYDTSFTFAFTQFYMKLLA